MFEEALKALQEKLGVEPVGAPATGLCPLAHIAPLGFALAIKWMLELLCKMDKYVPSDEVAILSFFLWIEDLNMLQIEMPVISRISILLPASHCH